MELQLKCVAIYVMLLNSVTCLLTFDRTFVTFIDQSNREKTIKQTGSIKDNIHTQNITKILITTNNEVPTLYKNSVVNLDNLNSFYMSGNGLTVIKVGAFANLNKLQTIVIRNNSLEEVNPEVFENIPLITLNLANNKIANIVKDWHTDANLENIYLNHNLIVHLHPRIFANLRNLKSINLSNNGLKRATQWYGESPVNLIDLSRNNITHVDSFAFGNLKNLTTVHLHYNHISTIHESAFHGTTHLSIVNLHHNEIKSLPANLFQSLRNTSHKMRLLALETNELTFLPQKLLDDVNMEKIKIDNNPWECSCYLNIVRWSERKKITLNTVNNNDPVCIYAKDDTSGRCDERVNRELVTSFFDLSTYDQQFYAGVYESYLENMLD